MAISTTDAKLRFLRGLEANLPSDKTDGYVYITTDTQAMYVDYASGSEVKRMRIGDVLTVSAVANLPAIADAQYGVLYYAASENILCTPYLNGSTKEWKQINKQKTFADFINSLTTSVTGTTGTSANVKLTITAADKSSQNTSFDVTAAGGTNVKAESGKLKITSADTTVTGKISAADNKISLTNTTAGTNADGSSKTASTAAGGAITIAGSGATVTTASDTITITAKPTLAASWDTTGNLNFVVNYDDKSKAAAETITPTIVYGANNGSTAKFVSGSADLDVYTKAETDSAIADQLRTANAMTFKGVVNSTTALPTSEVALGDTYVVDAAGTYNGQANCKVGDMFIAGPGTENAKGYLTTVTWTYVPAGNDDYAETSGTVSATDGAVIKSTIAKVDTKVATIKASDGLTMAADSTNKVLTIKHATTTVGSDTAGAVTQTAGSGTSYTAVTGITTDSYGHITKISTGKFTVTDTKVSSTANTVAAGTNQATISTSVTDSSKATASGASFIIKTSGNSSLTVTGNANDKTVVIDSVWGSF